jgi:hypothetical protein
MSNEGKRAPTGVGVAAEGKRVEREGAMPTSSFVGDERRVGLFATKEVAKKRAKQVDWIKCPLGLAAKSVRRKSVWRKKW